MTGFKYGLLVTSALLSLSACSSDPKDPYTEKELIHKGQYWQRASASSAAYMRGPKAQHILNRDIASCVAELKELQRLGSLKDAFPPGSDLVGNPIDVETPVGRMAGFDTPERDGPLLTEVFDYTDFESCMHQNGWERVEYLPYDQAVGARKNYTKTIMEPMRPPPPADSPYAGRVYPEKYNAR